VHKELQELRVTWDHKGLRDFKVFREKLVLKGLLAHKGQQDRQVHKELKEQRDILVHKAL
jgi:hypothetical protein